MMYFNFAWVCNLAIFPNIRYKNQSDVYEAFFDLQSAQPSELSKRFNGKPPKGHLSRTEAECLSDTAKTAERLLAQFEWTGLKECCITLEAMLSYPGLFEINDDIRKELCTALGNSVSHSAGSDFAEIKKKQCEAVALALKAAAFQSDSKFIRNGDLWQSCTKEKISETEALLKPYKEKIKAEISDTGKISDAADGSHDTASECSDTSVKSSSGSESSSAAENSAAAECSSAVESPSAAASSAAAENPENRHMVRKFLKKHRLLCIIAAALAFFCLCSAGRVVYIFDNYVGVSDVTQKYIGCSVCIRTVLDGQYVSCNTYEDRDDVDATASHDTAGDWETFLVEEGPDGTVGFRAANGNYLGICDHETFPIRAAYGQNYTEPQNYEQFRIYEKNGYIFIRSEESKKYVRVVPGNARKIIRADSPRINAYWEYKCEAFLLEPATPLDD